MLQPDGAYRMTGDRLDVLWGWMVATFEWTDAASDCLEAQRRAAEAQP